MSIENVKAYFRAHGMEGRILEFEESSATVDLAAQAVGCEPARIAKTLSFSVEGRPVLVVTAGDMRIAGPKFKAVFHEKPRMLAADEVEEKIGHGVGGVCPFAVKEGVKVYLDVSMVSHEIIYFLYFYYHSYLIHFCYFSNKYIHFQIHKLIDSP